MPDWFTAEREGLQYRVAPFLEATNLAREWVNLAEVVQHRAEDPVFGERPEFAPAPRIEAVDCLDQSNGAGGNEVVEFDLRATPVKPAGEQIHLLEMTEDEVIAGLHGGLPRRKMAAYAATSGFGFEVAGRSRRVIRLTRISVTDFFAPSLAVYSRVWISPVI